MSTLKRSRVRRKRKGGELTRQQTIEVAKVARNVVARTGELKFRYYQLDHSPMATAYVFDCVTTGISEGTADRDQRVGRDITIYSIDVRLNIDNTPNATADALVRIALVRTKTAWNMNSVDDFIENHATVDTTYGQYAMDLQRNGTVLYDRVHNATHKDADSGGQYLKPIHFYKKWKRGALCSWLVNGSESIGHLWFLAMTDVGTRPNIQGEVLVRFRDA